MGFNDSFEYVIIQKKKIFAQIAIFRVYLLQKLNVYTYFIIKANKKLFCLVDPDPDNYRDRSRNAFRFILTINALDKELVFDRLRLTKICYSWDDK
jgi:hypothetical protein